LGAAWKGRGEAGSCFDVYQALAKDQTQNKFVKSQGIRTGVAKKEALGNLTSASSTTST
jgi:hypothetical protein